MSLASLVVGDYIMVAIVGEGGSIYSKAIGCGVILINMLLNCWSVKWVERIQIVFTVAKMIPIVMLVVTGWYTLWVVWIEN